MVSVVVDGHSLAAKSPFGSRVRNGFADLLSTPFCEGIPKGTMRTGNQVMMKHASSSLLITAT